MRRDIASLHYLTQDLARFSHQDQVKMACAAGIKWVQLRVKNKNQKEWLKIATDVKQITSENDCILIINDDVQIAKEVDADGVHLGQEDMHWQAARKILGDQKLIGFSTHSMDELDTAKDFDVDYFGLGPFRFTATKEKLHPVLGKDGFTKIISGYKASEIKKPVIVIGGIQMNDVEEIMKAGAQGIAVSSAINLSDHPIQAIHQFNARLQFFHSKNKTLVS